jgi:hypothetical protein
MKHIAILFTRTINGIAVYVPPVGIVAMSLILACCCQVAAASSTQEVAGQSADLVTLTVTSTCGSASVRVKKNMVLTTPFSITFPRGKTLKLKALDTSVASCGALPVVSAFKRLIVNQKAIPEGQRAYNLTLDQDTAVMVQYDAASGAPVTLSVSAPCPRGANLLVTETTVGGQSGTFRTHFDAQFLSGQSLRLEAPALLAACSDLGNVLTFLNWCAAGKAYPRDQNAIELTVTEFTSAYASYGGIFPNLRIDSYQLLRNGVQAAYIRVGEDFGEFTFLLKGEPFPPVVDVFMNGEPAQILSRAIPTEIEIRLPTRKADAPGFSFVRVTSPDSRFSNAAPIEIRKD